MSCNHGVQDQQDDQRQQEEQGDDHEEEDDGPEGHCLGQTDWNVGAVPVLRSTVVRNGGDRTKTLTPTVFPNTSNIRLHFKVKTITVGYYEELLITILQIHNTIN